MNKIIVLTLILICCSTRLFPQSFTAGSLVVCRVGDGANALSSGATPVFLEERTTSGTLQQTIPMPVVASGANHILTLAGTATSEGLITRSADGMNIMIAGYNAVVGTASVSTTTGSAINRVIGRIDINGSVDASTALSGFASGGTARSAVSANGNNIWACGSVGGAIYTTLGSTNYTQILAAPANLRQLNIFNGQLYFSTGSGTD